MLRYVEPLNEARTKLANFFSILPEGDGRVHHLDKDVRAVDFPYLEGYLTGCGKTMWVRQNVDGPHVWYNQRTLPQNSRARLAGQARQARGSQARSTRREGRHSFLLITSSPVPIA
jgi:hypothetical protein